MQAHRAKIKVSYGKKIGTYNSGVFTFPERELKVN